MSDYLSPYLVLGILLLYFLMLIGVAWFTGRNSSNESFFLANRSVPWYVVAYAMIGTSISGVTFISLPGAVGLEAGANRSFGYMQVVLGYLLGYLVIATVLMPLFYRLQLTSIYGYLEQRFGFFTYKTGAGFFILSRALGSAARMYLAAMVLQAFVFNYLSVPFPLTVLLMLALIYAYTFKGGLKTILWTDTIMTTFFIVAVLWTVVTVSKALNLNSFGEMWTAVQNSRYSQIFFFDNFTGDPNHFVKQFVSGALVAIVMTGLDQDLMQKNLACKNIREAQKNMFVFCIYLILINLAFLCLGALLYLYANSIGIQLPATSDQLYPKIAFGHLDQMAGIFFVLGLVASTYASSDSALTALTTSFCVDFLNFEKVAPAGVHFSASEAQEYQAKIADQQRRTRTLVHLGFSLLFALIILILYYVGSKNVLSLIFDLASYTYGPLLGLYTFGLFTTMRLHDRFVPLVCLLAPVLTWLFVSGADHFLQFKAGFLTILINGLITLGGLWIISYREAAPARNPN
jgi:Na+/proline symporter